MGASSKIRWETYEGNQRSLPFQLRRRGQKGVWDVSAATSIMLEVTDPDGVDMTPIAITDGFAGSDWSLGLVTAFIDGSNVTARLGTYTFSVTVFGLPDDPEVTSATGVIDVLDRPGFTPP